MMAGLSTQINFALAIAHLYIKLRYKQDVVSVVREAVITAIPQKAIPSVVVQLHKIIFGLQQSYSQIQHINHSLNQELIMIGSEESALGLSSGLLSVFWEEQLLQSEQLFLSEEETRVKDVVFQTAQQINDKYPLLYYIQVYPYITSQRVMKLRICLIFVLFVLANNEKITLTCSPCSRCNSGFCQTTDGGPFNSNVGCVKNCTLTEWTFDISCSCSLSCGYTIILDGISSSGCSDSKDYLWPTIEQLLNSQYIFYNLGSSYSWCGGVCTGQIIGVVAGGVVLIGIGIAIFIYFKKRSARKQNTLIESPSRKSQRRSAIVIDNNLQ